MFDNRIVCHEGLQNETAGGAVVGFSFLARLPYYRGIGLSMVEDIGVTVDGESFPRDAIRFSVRGTQLEPGRNGNRIRGSVEFWREGPHHCEQAGRPDQRQTSYPDR